jgi:molybdopterin-guanine dinucleotide biosynthesis protein B
MKIFSFVAASSNSGKTTLIEKIVVILKARGLRVAVIKHASKGYDLDRPGKDSWRFRQAGADEVVLIGPGSMAVMRSLDHQPDPEQILPNVSADIVILEGFKNNAMNKIEVFRAGVSAEQPLCMSDGSFLALASDRPFNLPIPVFDLNDAEGIARFLMDAPSRKP